MKIETQDPPLILGVTQSLLGVSGEFLTFLSADIFNNFIRKACYNQRLIAEMVHVETT